MDMLKLYYFPPYLENNPDTNPYSSNYKESLSQFFNVIEKDRKHKGFARVSLVHKAFLADVYVLNWIESINKGIKNLPLFLASYLGILIILCRRKKIVWMLHNIHPHSGENMFTRAVQTLLYKYSTVIVTHSNEAKDYAKTRASCNVEYVCHPVKMVAQSVKCIKDMDILIWGAILPYKGVPEFLSLSEIQNSSLVVKIVGKCNDKLLAERITCHCNDHITFENRFAEKEELLELCQRARYVVFPYLTESVSSSGALIDTIAMGGIPIGPNVGAFKDLADEGVCLTYSNKTELLHLLNDNHSISEDARTLFVQKNSWGLMGKKIYNFINQ